MTDPRTIRRLRVAAGILLALTFVVVVWMGASPTAFSLSNGVGDVTCRAVLAPNTVTSLIGESEVAQETVEEWLVEVGFAETAADITAEDLDAATAKASELCVDARTARSGWMTLAGVIGIALSAAGIMLAESRTRRAAAS